MSNPHQTDEQTAMQPRCATCQSDKLILIHYTRTVAWYAVQALYPIPPDDEEIPEVEVDACGDQCGSDVEETIDLFLRCDSCGARQEHLSVESFDVV